MNRVRTFLQLPLLLGFEVVAVAVLHRLGDAPGLRAGTLVTGFAAPEDAVMAGARLVALGVAWWLLASTLLCAAARACRLPAAVRALEWVALPAVRRLVERSLAAALSLSVAAAALPASGASPAVAAASAGAGPPGERLVAPPASAALPVPVVDGGEVLPPLLAAPRARTPPPAADLPREHEVAEGEHLWRLAQAVVAEATGRDRAEIPLGEVATYWVRLIEANPASLRSGDPDLVFPGETLTLPRLDA